MNPFNPLSIVQSTFESDDVQHELKELVEIIRAYDIYDFLRRLSALNLQKENQNRAVLLDALQSAILYNDETYYTSSAKMSAGKFSSIIKKMDSISLVQAIDPNENVFTQNVMLYDNYTVFNGIDSYPAYRLQMLCEIFFGFKNSFPLEYIKKVYFLFSAMLKISTRIAKSIGISSEPPIIEAASTKVPSNETLTYHSKLISISRNNMLRMLNNDLDMLDIIAIQFGTHAWGSIDTRPFYTKPFLYDAGSGSYILLNIALLPEFMSFMALKIADTFKIKDAVVDMYNRRIWHDCKKSLAKLEHRKIKESSLHIELLDTNYYKEILLNVFNNQLMVVSFICDDALDYNAENMHDTYAPSKYTEAIIKREDYFAKKFKDNHIAPQNVFHLVILNGIGRAVSCSLKNVFSDYGIVHLNPFELHCISINEMKHTGFLPRYFVAKSSVKTLTSGLFSELNCITIYTDNHYSFYLSDDASPDNPLMLITPGGAPYYIGKALLAEDAILIKSYDDKTKIPVVLSDVKRKIYFDENFATKNVLSFCIRFSDVICVQIIEWAYRKDLLHYKMMNLPISILKSNRIGIKEAELVRMGQYSSRYRKEQLAYNSESFPSTPESNDYSKALDEAFLSAYSYSYTQLIVFIHLLVDFGEEHLQGEVVITTKDELLEYLYECDNEFSSEISTRILKDITLTAREDFMKAPAGFRKEDVYPWRFNRQYSFVRRPILCRGNDLIWGIRQLYHSLLYVTNLIYDGRLATTNKKMNTLMGRICNDQGDAFNQHISDIIKSFGVFRVFPNVKRINKKKIADEKSDVLGDIDVLIIDEKKHRIVVAEVKNFDFSKNPYEIQAEYQKMFVDGKKKSFATKHKRRVEWVIAHFDDVRAQYSLPRNKWTVHGVFITNEPLMSVNTYRKKLSVLSEAELSVESLRKIQ